MPPINQLSSVDTLAGGDQFPIYDASNGDARKVSASALLTFVQANFAQPGLEKQTAAPTSSGFTVTVAASTEDQIWLVLSPTGLFASGTVELPDNADTFDGQSVLVTSSQAITSLTLNSTGGVNGAPSSLGASGFFEVKYNASAGEWFCIAQSLGATDSFTDVTITGSILDANGNEVIEITTTGVAAVNHIAVVSTATGNGPAILARGDDADVALVFETKGNGDIELNPAGTGVVMLDGVQAVDLSSTQTLENKSLEITTVFNGYFKQLPYLVGITLPAASVGLLGARAFVTNSSVTTFNSVVAGGGANGVPVFCDGTDWRVG